MMNKTTHDFAMELLALPNINLLICPNENDDDERLYPPVLNFLEVEENNDSKNKQITVVISPLKKAANDNNSI